MVEGRFGLRSSSGDELEDLEGVQGDGEPMVLSHPKDLSKIGLIRRRSRGGWVGLEEL